MKVFLVVITFLFITSSRATSECSDLLFANDPQPWGGANCTKSLECGGADGGTCDITPPATEGTCVCPIRRGNPDCSYIRHGNNPAGGLNIGLPFVGIAGVGNFIIGQTGHGVGQLLLMLGPLIIMMMACCCAFCEFGQVFLIVIAIISSAGVLAGFIWSIVDGAAILECRVLDGLGYALYKIQS